MGGNILTGLGAGNAAGESVRYEQLLAIATTGSANAYVLSSGTTLAAYATGQTFLIIPNFTNTGAATINVDSIGAKDITKNGTIPLVAGDLVSGQVYRVSYDGTRFQVHEAVGSLFAGHIYGLTLANNGSDATNDIDIAVGNCFDSTNSKLITLAAALTKRLDASWAVGTNQGGLDTGSIADTTYHVWLIMRSDTGVVDVLFSTSASSPTMPSNYDYKRRIGSIMRASSAIRAFTQVGDEFLWTASPVQDMLAAPNDDNAATATITVPAGIKVIAIVQHGIQDTTPGAVTYALLSSLDTTDVAPSSARHNGFVYGSGAMAAIPNGQVTEVRVRTSTSSTIRRRITGRTADHVQIINTVGWIDTRGRLA